MPKRRSEGIGLTQGRQRDGRHRLAIEGPIVVRSTRILGERLEVVQAGPLVAHQLKLVEQDQRAPGSALVTASASSTGSCWVESVQASASAAVERMTGS